MAPPLFFYAVSGFFYSVVATFSGHNFFTVEDHNRWDSGLYLSIAQDGYEMYRCGDRFPDSPRPDIYCGNAAWSPLYPMLMRIVSAIGIPYQLAGVLVTEAALIGAFIVLWWLLGARLTPATALCMGIAAVFPGSIYFHAIFPVALSALGLLVSIAGLRANSWRIAGVGGAIAVAAHMVGAVMIGVLALSFIFAWRGEVLRSRLLKAAGATVVPLLALGWQAVLLRLGTGRWDAYSELQRVSYGHGGTRNPFESYRLFYDTRLPEPEPGTATLWVEASSDALRFQLLLTVTLVAVAAITTAVRAVRHKGLDVADCATVLVMIGVFLLPFVTGVTFSWYRNHAELLPALLLLRDAPRAVQSALLAACGVVAAMLGAHFYFGSLI